MRRNIFIPIIAFFMVFTAGCQVRDVAESDNSVAVQTTEAAISETSAPVIEAEEYITLPDGQELVFGSQIELPYCFVTKLGLPQDERVYTRLVPSNSLSGIGEKKYKGFEVLSAYTCYGEPQGNYKYITYQSLRLGGETTMAGTLEYIYNYDGDRIIGICFCPDKKTVDMLPSLKPIGTKEEIEWYYTQEKITFYLDIQKTPELFAKLNTRLLEYGDKAEVTIKTNDFILQWTIMSLADDVNTNGEFMNATLV